MLTDQDIQNLTKAQSQVFATKEDLTDLKEQMLTRFSDVQSSVDRYLKFTETWHQELTILKGRQDRLSQVLISKGIVSEQEIALLV